MFKILILSQYFWPESFLINSIVHDLKEMNVEVEVFTGKPNYPGGSILSGYKKFQTEIAVERGIKVYRIPIIPRGKKSVTLMMNYISFVLSGILFAKKMLDNSNYDLVYVYAPSPIFQALVGIYIKKIKNIPLILNVQDLWPESLMAAGRLNNKIVINVIKHIVFFIYKNCDLILCQSKSFKNIINQIIENKKIIYFPNTVDRVFLAKKNHDTEISTTKHKVFSVVFAGNIGAAQSIETILFAAICLQSNANIKFFIYGDGREKIKAVKFVKTHKLSNVIFCGRLSINEMPKIFDQASVLVLTLANSQVFSLTIPNRLQAYMSRGRPVVAAINGEGAEIIRGANCGIAVEAENSKGLAEAIEKMYQMPAEELNKLGNNGYIYFNKNFHPDTLTSELKNIFNDLVT